VTAAIVNTAVKRAQVDSFIQVSRISRRIAFCKGGCLGNGCGEGDLHIISRSKAAESIGAPVYGVVGRENINEGVLTPLPTVAKAKHG